MAMAENMADFFNSDEFAVTALYNGSVSVNVIYDHAYVDTYGTASTNPLITANAADFSSATVGQALVIDSINYKIQSLEPDGTGIVRIELTRA